MKIKHTPNKPSKSAYTILRQIVQHIPRGMMERTAKEHKADIRKLSCASHVVAITYGHLTKARSLSEICNPKNGNDLTTKYTKTLFELLICNLTHEVNMVFST